jgi:hypothetical protein
MLPLPGSSVRDDKLKTSASQTHGEAFHLCATAHLGVSTVKQTVYMAKSKGIDFRKGMVLVLHTWTNCMEREIDHTKVPL